MSYELQRFVGKPGDNVHDWSKFEHVANYASIETCESHINAVTGFNTGARWNILSGNSIYRAYNGFCDCGGSFPLDPHDGDCLAYGGHPQRDDLPPDGSHAVHCPTCNEVSCCQFCDDESPVELPEELP